MKNYKLLSVVCVSGLLSSCDVEQEAAGLNRKIKKIIRSDKPEVDSDKSPVPDKGDKDFVMTVTPMLSSIQSHIESMNPASQRLENLPFKLSSFATLNFGYDQNIQQSTQTLPTMTTGLKMGIFDVGAGHFAMPNSNAKHTTLESSHVGVSKQFEYAGVKFTPSFKFMQLAGNSKGMDLGLYQGKVMVNEISFSRNTLCFGAKADFGSSYIDVQYQSPVNAADKTKVLINNRDTKNWNIDSSRSLHLSAGFKSQNFNVQAQMSKSDANYLAYNFEFTVKE